MLIDCDTCHNFYHINCLDPPLSCVPRKTKLFGWECSKCVHLKNNSSDEEMEPEKYNAPRSLRRERKQKKIFDLGDEEEKTVKRTVKSKKSKKMNGIKKVKKVSL